MKKSLWVGLLMFGLMCGSGKVTMAQTATPSSSLPDLVVSTLVTEAPGTGGKFQIKMVFGNAGQGIVQGNSGYRLSLYVDPVGDPFDPATVPLDSVVLGNVVLNPGTTEYFAIQKELSVGTHKIYSRIDVDNVVKESNENNNASFNNYNVASSCGWCGDRCTKVTDACLMIPAPAGKICENNNGSCLIRTVNIPSSTPTTITSPIPTPRVCSSFSDDFGITEFGYTNFNFWTNGSGTKQDNGRGSVKIVLPKSTEAWSKMALMESKYELRDDFASEITVISRKDDSSYAYFQFNNKKWDWGGSNGFGFRLLDGSLKTEVYGSDNPNNPGSLGHNINIPKDVPVKLILERRGSTIYMYYDLMSGAGRQLLSTFYNFNVASGFVIFGTQHSTLDNIETYVVFDDYKQTCGGGVSGVKGDANGDGKANLVDFSIWKNEYLSFVQMPLTSYPSSLRADFNQDTKVDLVDFSIWKAAYLKN